MGIAFNTEKTKVMIIKLKKTNYNNYIYDNICLEKIYSYKYLGINIHNQLNWNYSIEKRIIRGWKCYYRLENNCKLMNILTWSKKKFSLRHSSHVFFYMDVRFEVTIYLENHGETLSLSKCYL